MNYEGKLVSNLKFFEPLSIDVQMEYEIDDNLFPGLDNPEQNPPTLIYDLTQEDDEEETTSSDDDIISLIGMSTHMFFFSIAGIIHGVVGYIAPIGIMSRVSL